MARNEEKAMSALNRWTSQLQGVEDGEFAKGKARYKLSFEVDNVKECEHWRGQTLREVTKMIGEIQNAGLGEHRIRDMNDEINRLLREKGHWEDRIKDLGGADYKKAAPKSSGDAMGAELAGQSGYKYFGAAKDLPGVRELFEKEEVPEAPRKTRKQLFKNLQPDYYGWRDEEDGMLLLAEQEREVESVKREVETWEAEQRKKRKLDSEAAAQTPAPAPEPTGPIRMDFKAYVDVPTMEDIEQLIIRKKKEALLRKYGHAEGVSDIVMPSGKEDDKKEAA